MDSPERMFSLSTGRSGFRHPSCSASSPTSMVGGGSKSHGPDIGIRLKPRGAALGVASPASSAAAAEDGGDGGSWNPEGVGPWLLNTGCDTEPPSAP